MTTKSPMKNQKNIEVSQHHLANPVCQVDGEMPSEEKLLDAMQRLTGALQAAPTPGAV